MKKLLYTNEIQWDDLVEAYIESKAHQEFWANYKTLELIGEEWRIEGKIPKTPLERLFLTKEGKLLELNFGIDSLTIGDISFSIDTLVLDVDDKIIEAFNAEIFEYYDSSKTIRDIVIQKIMTH